MKLWDRIKTTGVRSYRPDGRKVTIWTPEQLAAWDPVKVFAPEVFSLAESVEHLDIWGPGDLGVVRPPYPLLWVEGTSSTHGISTQVGYLVREASAEEAACLESTAGLAVYGSVFWNHRSGAVMMPWWFGFGLDDEGRASRYEYDVHHPDLSEWLDDVNARQAPTAALYALSLMNCKNVRLDDGEDPPPALARRHQRRHGVPMSRFSRIVLPGPPRTASHGPGSTNPTTPAHHMVRGHFKTYTAEAPLLGRHTGTYWWGWQVRGDKERGEVTPEYVVELPE